MNTPERYTVEKKLRTPPSIDHDTSTSTRRKLLRGLSGKVFRKTPDLKLEQKATFGPSTFSAPKTPLHLSKRQNVPSPLNFNQLLSPPPTLRKKQARRVVSSPLNHKPGQKQKDQNGLLSPFDVFPSKSASTSKLKNPLQINLTEDLLHSSLLEPVKINSVEDMILSDNEDDFSFLPQESPTFAKSFPNNSKNSRSVSGPKRFLGENCSMCDEQISSKFGGEKVIELDCCHTCHFECYLVMFKFGHFEGKTPECKFCRKATNPKEEEMLQLIVSKALTSSSSDLPNSSTSIKQQWIELKTSEADRGFAFNSTPIDQLIRTADITSNGYQSSLLSAPIEESTSVEEYIGRPYLDNKNLIDILKSESQGIVLNLSTEDDEEEVDDLAALEKMDDVNYMEEIEIEVKTNSSNSDVDLTLTFPDLLNKNDNKDTEKYAAKVATLTNQIETYISDHIDKDDQFGKLIMFDKITYSTDGERWSDNIIAFLFTQYLVFYDSINKNVTGKIPLDQISNINKLKNRMMLIDLKTRTLPEVYLLMPFTGKDDDITSKWKYYLQNSNGFNELEFHIMTSTAWNFFPVNIYKEVQILLESEMGQEKLSSIKPWIHSNSVAPIELILCLNLSTNDDVTIYKKELKDVLKTTLSKLNKNDRLGLVLMGRDGNDNIGEYGKFIGMINKEWDGWDEIIEDLDIIDHEVFSSTETLGTKAFETCNRMLITTCFPQEDESNLKPIKQLAIINKDKVELPNQGLIGKYKQKIEEDYHCTISNFLSGDALVSVSKTIDSLHKRRYQNIVISFDEGNDKIKLGCMAPNDAKTVKVSNILPDKIANLANLNIEWYDCTIDTTKRIKKKVTLVI
ncbi:hypothetical protein Kpol_2001p20 [Vanderwaltozyma polyspora DSM 70294]|uniref:RING-type domain-containing protein n=1 Tax=Vanderwaltozyma polyspora (strain ATCC 22028 / DSM 70294 / BCRC 21397 / CBS 2163 / NBRC 10782 / NRRL Y-8283 / UCD 57-17) TaxID=436907 RepID=A7TGQ6_VANPO|nr:uncharacterized protein Kpol_2001p20 [Vanderwaltozyma polyspora DSM 70294]EDO18519.1 hypothetical protein Kpol_2001p20 [Vanderwaltozyma polyspora DSM 70294]